MATESISPRAFRLIQGHVGIVKQVVKCVVVPVYFRDAHADGDLTVADDIRNIHFLNSFHEPLNRTGCALDIGVMVKDTELFTAQSSKHVELSKLGRAGLGQASQNFITDSVTKCIVNGFKVVYVND